MTVPGTTHEDGSLYNEFPPFTIGGPTGNYTIPADVKSARWVEYRVVSIAASNNGSCLISGRAAPPQGLDYSGGTTYNDDSRVPGEAYSMGGSGSFSPGIEGWRRIASSERKLYIRIDTNGALFVSIQFRARILERIPGPSTTVHPDHEHQMNVHRANQIQEHMQSVGIPGYAHKGSQEKD